MNDFEKEPILITGYGSITPLGNDVNTYFNNLISGKSGIGYIEKFDTENLPVHIGAEVKDFYPEDYMPKKLAHNMDTFMQYAFAAASEALNDASLAPDKNGVLPVMPERIGVVVGTVFSGIHDIADTANLLHDGTHSKANPRFITKIIGNMAAAEIAISNGFRGPSLTVSTACSSGLDAITTGAMLLRQNMADIIVAVGTEAATCPVTILGLSSIHALSTSTMEPDKVCCPFDLGRSGFVISEGAGAIVLERKSSALSRSVTPHSILSGFANCTDGYHATRPHPDGIGALFCMNECLKEADITSDQVDYINAHGTSTSVGDIVEAKAIRKLFPSSTPVSSTKSAVGHPMGASGLIETIACIKAIENDIMPPTLNQNDKDPECDIDTIPNIARKGIVKHAMCNAFGFGGQNASILVSKINL